MGRYHIGHDRAGDRGRSVIRHYSLVRLFLLALIFRASTLSAQAAAQDPAAIRSLSVDGGYALRFGDASTSDGFYRVVYQGKPVKESGTPFKWARAIDLLAPTPAKVAGDIPTIRLRYENSDAYADGGLLEVLGAKQLPIAALSKLHLRGTAQISGDVKLRQIQAAVGLESPPVRLPGLAGTGISNWLVVGLNAERREATDAEVGDSTLALGTFRSFVGKALGWRKSANVEQTTAKIVHDLFGLAPTHAAAIALKPKLDAIPAATRTVLQQTLLDLIPEVTTDAEWETKVRALATGQAEAITDQPTAALYAEWSGWVNLSSKAMDDRFRSLVTASLDYWFLPRRDDVLLRVRYERGYERASPATERNQLLISIGLRL